MTHCLKQVVYGPGFDGVVDPLTANVFLHPTFQGNRLSMKTIYADDQVTPLYYEYTIELETIIYDHTNEAANNSIEAEVNRIRQILATPNQKLLVYPVGLGKVAYINANAADLVALAALDATNYTGVTATPEVSGGPFPQDTVVMPIGSNNAISVKWSCTFRILHCTILSFVDPNSTIEFNFESDFDVDSDGDLTLTANVTYKSMYPVLDGSYPALIDIKKWFTDALTYVAVAPPFGAWEIQPVQQFTFGAGILEEGHRIRSKTSISRDRRAAKLTFISEPVKSPNALFPPASDIKAVDTIQSDLMTGGFQKWHRVLDVDITLRRNWPKHWAWFIYRKILAQKMRYVGLLKDVRLIPNNEVVAPERANQKLTTNYFPIKFVFKDDIYSRKVMIHGEFLVNCSLRNILQVSNIFGRVHNSFDVVNGDRKGQGKVGVNGNTPASDSDQWARWILASTNAIDGNSRGFIDSAVFSVCGADLPAPLFKQQATWIVDPMWNYSQNCSPNQPVSRSDAAISTNTSTYYAQTSDGSVPTQDEQIEYGQIMEDIWNLARYNCGAANSKLSYDPEESWMDYKTSISIIEDCHSIPLDFLDESGIAMYQTPEANPGNATNLQDKYFPDNPAIPGYNAGQDQSLYATKFFALNGILTPRDYTNTKKMVISRSSPRFFIRFQGYAIRALYPVPIPHLLAFKTGSGLDSNSTLFRKVTRIGRPKCMTRQTGPSANPVYLAKWDILYTIDHDIHYSNILARLFTNTDGAFNV